MLVENTLFGVENKINDSINKIREYESIALNINSDGYYVAFSGGKDSIVIYDLVKKSGVKHKIYFNKTSVDPPELLSFIKENYNDVIWIKPNLSMFELIRKKKMLPIRIARFCCEHLKENNELSDNKVILTGVRWDELYKRSKRKQFEACTKTTNKFYFHPIINWSNEDVWQYIKENNLKYCELYDKGFNRIGCIGCPMSPKAKRKNEFLMYPKFKKAYMKQCQYLIDNKYMKNFDNAQDLFNWWIEDVEDDYIGCPLFE